MRRYEGRDGEPEKPRPSDLSLVFNEANASFNVFDRARLPMLLRKTEQLYLK